MSDKNCANCRHALSVESRQSGFRAEDYRHCAKPHPELATTLSAWLIGARSGCAHTPSKWEPR